jgi:hypothetical protein
MATTVESHTHSCQRSSDGSSWTEFGAYVEHFETHGNYQADRQTVDISCYVYPSGLAENDYVICYVDGVAVFDGRMARPALHGYGQSVVIQCEGRGAYLAKKWKGDGVDPELDALFNRVYESVDDAEIIVNLCTTAGVELSKQLINSSSITRGTIYPVTLRTGETYWSIIRGDQGLDEPVGYWTAERKDGVIFRGPIALGSPAFTADETDNIISIDRTPLGTESIENRCIYYGFEYELLSIGGIGVGDYSEANSNIDGYNPRIFHTNIVESDAEALAAATSYVVRHNFPYDETRIVLLGDTSIDIGQTVRIDAPVSADHDGTSAADRFIADVVHAYGVGVGYETRIIAIRVAE